MNFPEFSESKGILKIGQSEVCVWGGGPECHTLISRHPVYIYILDSTVIIFSKMKNVLFSSNDISQVKIGSFLSICFEKNIEGPKKFVFFWRNFRSL